MKIEILSITEDAERLIETAARTCYNSKMGDKVSDKFLQGLIKSGHESPVEHGVMTVRVTGVSRSATHQIVRHRLFSFCQESQRYVNQENAKFVTPDSIAAIPEAKLVYDGTMTMIRDCYKRLLDMGVKAEDARFLLPNATETTIVITGNFREWRHFFDLRCDRHAQWEIRKMALSLLKWLVTSRKAYNVFIDLAGKYFSELPEDFELCDVETPMLNSASD